MKRLLTSVVLVCLAAYAVAQAGATSKIQGKMKLNAGIVTEKLAETKAFYTNTLGFGVSFENEFYLLLHTPNRENEISFLFPNHPSQQALFHKPFQQQGMYLTIEVDDVDQIYHDLKSQGIEIKIDIRDEPWGDRHFAIQDPNGIGIDIVTYTAQDEQETAGLSANKVTWFSIPADDINRATTFYKEAFNWEILPETKEDEDVLSYYVALNSKSDGNYVSEERGVLNGCIVKRAIGLPSPAVLVEVDDLDAAVEKVKQAGGEIASEKVLMKSLNGHFVLVKDTEGNYVELFQNTRN